MLPQQQLTMLTSRKQEKLTGQLFAFTLGLVTVGPANAMSQASHDGLVVTSARCQPTTGEHRWAQILKAPQYRGRLGYSGATTYCQRLPGLGIGQPSGQLTGVVVRLVDEDAETTEDYRLLIRQAGPDGTPGPIVASSNWSTTQQQSGVWTYDLEAIFAQPVVVDPMMEYFACVELGSASEYDGLRVTFDSSRDWARNEAPGAFAMAEGQVVELPHIATLGIGAYVPSDSLVLTLGVRDAWTDEDVYGDRSSLLNSAAISPKFEGDVPLCVRTESPDSASALWWTFSSNSWGAGTPFSGGGNQLLGSEGTAVVGAYLTGGYFAGQMPPVTGPGGLCYQSFCYADWPFNVPASNGVYCEEEGAEYPSTWSSPSFYRCEEGIGPLDWGYNLDHSPTGAYWIPSGSMLMIPAPGVTEVGGVTLEFAETCNSTVALYARGPGQSWEVVRSKNILLGPGLRCVNFSDPFEVAPDHEVMVGIAGANLATTDGQSISSWLHSPNRGQLTQGPSLGIRFGVNQAAPVIEIISDPQGHSCIGSGFQPGSQVAVLAGEELRESRPVGGIPYIGWNSGSTGTLFTTADSNGDIDVPVPTSFVHCGAVSAESSGARSNTVACTSNTGQPANPKGTILILVQEDHSGRLAPIFSEANIDRATDYFVERFKRRGYRVIVYSIEDIRLAQTAPQPQPPLSHWIPSIGEVTGVVTVSHAGEFALADCMAREHLAAVLEQCAPGGVQFLGMWGCNSIDFYNAGPSTFEDGLAQDSFVMGFGQFIVGQWWDGFEGRLFEVLDTYVGGTPSHAPGVQEWVVTNPFWWAYNELRGLVSND